MTESFVIRGKWFLPTNLEIEVPGVLNYHRDKGVELEIEEPFTGTKSLPFDDLNDAEIILGESLAGEPITLYSCFRRNTTWGNRYQSTWFANYAFVGCHTPTWEGFHFKKIVLNVKPLFMWLNSSGIQVANFAEHDEPTIYTFKNPDSIEFDIDNQVAGKFRFTSLLRHPDSYSETIGLTHSAVVSIEVVEDIDIHHDTLWQYARRFLNWLTVATGYPCEVEKVSFYHKNLINKELRDGTIIEGEIVRYRQQEVTKRTPDTPYEFLFDFPDVKNYVFDALPRWFGLYSTIEIVVQILAENMGRQVAFSEFHFKDIVQALEAFHRKRIRNSKMPKAEYKAFKERILEQIINVDDQAFLKEKLNYGNEPSLRERLIELLDIYNIPALHTLIGDKDRFIKLVVDNRNYHTHLDASGKATILKPTELYFLSEKTLALLFAIVINEVISDKSYIDKVLRSSRRWGRIIARES